MVFSVLDASAAPVTTLRTFRAPDYSALLQVGGAMFSPALYRGFHIIGVPLSAGYPIARSGDGPRWTGRLALGDVSLHSAGSGERIVWPEGARSSICTARNARRAKQHRGGSRGAWSWTYRPNHGPTELRNCSATRRRRR